jgi:hypothetical protein
MSEGVIRLLPRGQVASSTNRAYDRIITFGGDISTSDGRCVAVILKTQALRTQFFLPSMTSLEGVGEIFLLE